jgi:DNA polymerase III subunit epsilon
MNQAPDVLASRSKSEALAELDVLVIDCQTTGATPHHGDVLEIGWTTVRAAAVEPVSAHRVALPEGRRIPRVVSRLTGLVRESLEGALAPADAWMLLCAKAAEIAAVEGEPAPTVIHFARFELAFLHDLHQRFAPGAPFPFDVVCAHEIARRLLPDLPRRGLRALAGYFGHGVDLERRSGGHVEATAFVWRRLLSELDGRGVRSFGELKAWLEAPAPRAGRRAFPLPRERRLSLPDAPGVYRFLRTNGDVLYVGKATSLRKRVSSHFTSGRPGERALEMLTQARDVAAIVTASALEAALLESDEIKTIDPPYNVQLRRHEHRAWFVSPDLRDAAARPEARGSIGPLPSRYSLSPFAAVRALASGEAMTASLRARSVGVPLDFAPDEASFAAGWGAFVARHLAPVRSRTPWGVLLKASKALFRLWGDGALDEAAAEADRPRTWDADRVRRHLERSVVQGGQLLRRARWLCLLSESSIVWREPDAATRRLLVVAGADIVERRDLAAGEPIPTPPGWKRPWHERKLAFDAVRYDRLRVLATELKRVSAETGDVAVRVDDRHELRAESLARVLRWV